MMSHMDVWPTTATMVGLTPPPHGEWKDNNGKPIYFDGIDNTAYVTGKAKHSARDGWIYIDGENFLGIRADVSARPGDARPQDCVEGTLLVEGHLDGPDAEHGRRSVRPTTSPWTRTRNTT